MDKIDKIKSIYPIHPVNPASQRLEVWREPEARPVRRESFIEFSSILTMLRCSYAEGPATLALLPLIALNIPPTYTHNWTALVLATCACS